jgi:two-component system phosphate regulon sensor histidine kinase PhoR
MSSEITYPWFHFYRIARLSFLVFLPTIFIILFFYRSTYKDGLISQMRFQVEENLKTTKSTLDNAHINWLEWCEKLRPENTRYTLVNEQGLVLCDTYPDKKGTQIQDASEIQGALKDNFQSQVRYSDVYKTQSLFAALKINDSMVIRKIVPITSLKDDMNRFDRVIFFRIVPIAFLSYVIFLYLYYQATKPLGGILDKVKQFKIDLPFNKNLKLLYKNDEWSQIQEALSEADHQLKSQILNVKTENEKIAAILESIYDDIIAVDPYETVLFYNSNFKQNFMKEKDYNNITPKIFHTFSDETVLNAFKSVLKNGETVSLEGLTFLSSLRPDRYFDLTITSLKNAEGKISGALGVFYDVTEFKKTEQMRVDFVANVSHEIRTPLTSIKGYTQVLESQKTKIDPELHLFLGKIISNTERMISLFNDLLNLSVIESKNIMKFEELDLKEIVQAIAGNIKTNYPHKKIQIQKDVQLESITGDQRLIEQVLSNLVDNACKYSGEDISIKISTFAKDGKGYIAVADNGPGIPKEHIQRIFERFYRVDSSRESSRGTGLGLSIVKHIIAKHGGRIWAESQEAHGANFIIELPLV